MARPMPLLAPVTIAMRDGVVVDIVGLGDEREMAMRRRGVAAIRRTVVYLRRGGSINSSSVRITSVDLETVTVHPSGAR